MDRKSLLCFLIGVVILDVVTCQPRPRLPPPKKQMPLEAKPQQSVSEASMMATFRQILQKYKNKDTCKCANWPNDFNQTSEFYADFTTAGAFVVPATGTGVSWHVALSGTLPCQPRGVLKLEPPSWANTLIIDLCLQNPTDWSFHLADDPYSNGYGGSIVGHWNCSEVHSLNHASLVYRAFDGTNRNQLLINYFRNSVSSGPYTIKVKKPGSQGDYVGINNYEGLDADIYDDLLFDWDTMYFGINRVVQSTIRQGKGVCFINVRWEA